MRIIIPLVSLALAFCVPQSPAAEPAPKQAPSVDCTISADATCKLGEVPNISVTLTNNSKSDIYLVGSLDASDCKWCYPHCYFEVIGPDGKPATGGVGRCGNTNQLREQDFVKVPAGKSFNPYMTIDNGFFSAYQISKETFRNTGEYRIRFFYSSKADKLEDWVGKLNTADAATVAKLAPLLEQVPRLELTSNQIKITIIAPAK